MNALVLCGGRGTRLASDTEKPLFWVAGVPMVDAVLDALAESRIDRIIAVTSPHVPDTREHLRKRGTATFDASGEGYVADLTAALETVDLPALTVVADLPLLAPEHIDRTIETHDGRNRTVCVPAALKEALGVSAETTLADPRSAERASGERGTSNASPRTSDPRASAHGGTELVPTGLNIVGTEDEETIDVRWDARLAVNVNRRGDAAVAEVLARGP